MQIDPAERSARDLYFTMISAIVPRPIAWVSTRSTDGVENLAPFSFFTGVTANPPTLLFCAGTKRDGSPKDTPHNAETQGEFVVNVVPTAMAEAMVETSAELPAGVSEAEVGGIETVASVRVSPPRVVGAPVQFECVTHQVVPIHDGEERITSRIVIGRIVLIHVDDAVLDRDGRIDVALLDPLARLGGQSYASLGEQRTIPRPT